MRCSTDIDTRSLLFSSITEDGPAMAKFQVMGLAVVTNIGSGSHSLRQDPDSQEAILFAAAGIRKTFSPAGVFTFQFLHLV